MLFLIGSFWYFHVTRTSIKAWMSSNFRQIKSLQEFDFWHIQTADIVQLIGPEKTIALLLENYSKYFNDFTWWLSGEQSLPFGLRFCFSMSFVSSANLPSYFRSNPGNRRDRPTSFGWDVFIRRILNKRSNQVKVLLYRASIWMIVEVLCKFKCIFLHRFIITFLIPFSEVSSRGECQLPKFQQQYYDRWVCPVSEYPETD